jgi:16S rRNA processing protein RimM
MYLIGYITKPKGIKGEVKVEPVTPNPHRFNRLEKVFIQLNDKSRAFPIEKIRVSGQFVYIKFSGISSRSEAELLRNAEVLINKKDLIQPAKDEYFVHDLIGCQVLSDENDEIGVIFDVVQMSSNDVYVIRNNDGTEYLIPAIKEVIKRVDIGQKRIIIKILEGLFD